MSPKSSKPKNYSALEPILTLFLDDAESDFTKLRCVVRVIPVFDWPSCPFGAARLAPSRSNLRSGPHSEATCPASPIYNSDVASDGSAIQTATYMGRIANRSDAFAQAALLLKTWASQRNLKGEVGLSHCLHVLSTLLAYVLDGTCKGVRTVPAGSGAWQAFKATLDCLGKSREHVFTLKSSRSLVVSPYRL